MSNMAMQSFRRQPLEGTGDIGASPPRGAADASLCSKSPLTPTKSMALTHAHPGQVVDLSPASAEAGISVSHALFKSEQLELIQLILPAGKWLPVHSVPGEITVQCLKVHIDLHINGSSRSIRGGQLLHVECGVPHSLCAIEDASALVTIVFTKP